MGYTTDFYGEWLVTPPLKPEHIAYLNAFATTRRVKRDEILAEQLPDPVRIAAGLPIGDEGAYYVGSASDGNMGQSKDISVTDDNEPPGRINSARQPGVPFDYSQYRLQEEADRLMGAQPGLWCQWISNESGTAIEWDTGEKFYEYIGWIEYLIGHFLGPWGYQLNGEVHWQGESSDDEGVIRITNNLVEVGTVVKTYDFS